MDQVEFWTTIGAVSYGRKHEDDVRDFSAEGRRGNVQIEELEDLKPILKIILIIIKKSMFQNIQKRALRIELEMDLMCLLGLMHIHYFAVRNKTHLFTM